ncbi:TBC-domain-containing protein [Tilletiaria anomala UBC 951]|uniref:TBC-domain-containing protein n=1 Tax=Tilletiaria anomala (strain ATCC 24038 / CBS 436.72 / UBC 951) TaxID=1037660 RepID=A0A066VLW8_TILAU|nr:TBC-domain-containing protein [Tilletiaria anomala UBC 951]KDN42737.1 TBC-domain-containing protein [Tilletiaria anomala UBC 951]
MEAVSNSAWPATLQELQEPPVVQSKQQGQASPISRIRHEILNGAIPHAKVSSASSWRSISWKLLLGIESLPAKKYLDLVAQGPSVAHEKIRNDTFRTLTTDQGFKESVHEDQLIRVLDAFVWSHTGEDEDVIMADAMDGYEFTYVQGMNVLAAPFLFTMPTELEAYYCLKRFIEVCCPLYVQPTLVGVHKGLQLLDQCLEAIDLELYTYLRSKNLSAELYAFPSVLTLCACTPPLDQVLHLWDFLLAFGVHMNILCVLAQLLIMRDELLAEASPMKMLRTLPPFNARRIISIAVDLAGKLSPALQSALVAHTYDASAVEE